jgi:hypothetical protein
VQALGAGGPASFCRPIGLRSTPSYTQHVAPSRAETLEAHVRTFLELLGDDPDDEIMTSWLAAGQGDPEAGKAAWARKALGLSAVESQRLSADFRLVLDYGQSGLIGQVGLYVVLRGPRGPVRLALWDREGKHSSVQIVGVEVGRVRGTLTRLPRRRS